MARWLVALSLKLNLFLCLCLFCTGVFAWGKDGHRVVGVVADNHLTAKARIAMRKIMQSDSLADIANWMDEVRNTPEGDAMKPWHFESVDICTRQHAPCLHDQCASKQIEKAVQTLKTSSSPPEQLQALRVLVHLVGDIHQPLHSAENGGDHGANAVKLLNRPVCLDYSTKKPGACNLHQYWDNTLVRKAMLGQSEKQFALGLVNKISTVNRASGELDAGNVGNVGHTDNAPQIATWISAANALAKSTAYNYSTFACHAGAAEVTLSDSYDKAALAVVQQQLGLAGVRLASIVNGIFGPR